MLSCTTRNLIKNGSDQCIKVSYRITVNPDTGEIFVTVTKGYVSPGTLYGLGKGVISPGGFGGVSINTCK